MPFSVRDFASEDPFNYRRGVPLRNPLAPARSRVAAQRAAPPLPAAPRRRHDHLPGLHQPGRDVLGHLQDPRGGERPVPGSGGEDGHQDRGSN